jgi:hypothetical protein
MDVVGDMKCSKIAEYSVVEFVEFRQKDIGFLGAEQASSFL